MSKNKLAYLKRATPVIRDTALKQREPASHPLIEKSARAISDWHSEVDWPLHVDQAIRTIEVVAEYLGREGFKDAQSYLSSTVWREPKHRVSQTKLIS
jgi:hypothetical protein